MQYYHQLITEKSFQYLQGLKREFRFILIGGWAVYIYTQALKSKDIDIIVDYAELGKLKEKYSFSKNERLKKYEIKVGEFDVDIYLRHYSDLGIDILEIEKNTYIRNGFLVPWPEILFLLKLFVYSKRRGSNKGQKDELDILSLMSLPEFSWKKYLKLIKDYKFTEYNELFIALLKKTGAVKELDINEQKMAKIKKEIFAQMDQ